MRAVALNAASDVVAVEPRRCDGGKYRRTPSFVPERQMQSSETHIFIPRTGSRRSIRRSVGRSVGTLGCGWYVLLNVFDPALCNKYTRHLLY